MNRSVDLIPGSTAGIQRRAGRRFALSLGVAVMATLMVAGTSLAAPGGPWQQQSTTCLIGPHLDPGHVYVNTKTGKTTCKRD